MRLVASSPNIRYYYFRGQWKEFSQLGGS